jgi:hypothetical protein
MNFKNTINSTKETLKKQAKNLALSTAIIASLTACGPSDKKAETTTPTDSTKTEVVAKDSTKTVIPQDNTEASIDELAELDEILEEADEAHAEIQAEMKEELKKTLKELKLTKKEYAERTEAYHTAEEARNIAEGYFKKFLKTANAPRDKEWLGLVEETITEYKEVIKILNEPESELARKTQKLYEQKKAEANK